MMGGVQPGIGYNVTQTADGSSLEILFPEQAAYGPEQFKVEMYGDNVWVAKGRVIAMQSVTTSPMYSSQQALTEFNVQGFAIYPTDSRTEGSDIPNSIWASDGYVTIQKYTPGESEGYPATGSDTWGVYIVRNQLSSSGGDGTLPLLAVIADGSDAYTKSTAFPTDTEGHYNWDCYQQVAAVTVEGEGGGSGNLMVSMLNYALGNYAAERIKIASIVYENENWKVTQLLIGTLTLPGYIGGGEIQWVSTLPSYPSATLPGFKSTTDAWFGTWTGYTKLLTTGSGYTTNIVAS
jgi:hypothetical protein